MRNAFWLPTAMALALASQSNATIFSTYGDQDFAEGTIVFSNDEFLLPQAGEPSPIGVQFDPSTFQWTHTFAPSADASLLTISLWDLDANFPANQVASLLVNGVAQDVSPFEAFQDGDRVHLYQLPLAPGSLSTGSATVSLTLDNLSGNAVGFDFAQISSIPEPASLALLGGVLSLCLRRRGR